MSALCAISLNTSPLPGRQFMLDSARSSKMRPNDPDANEPGSMEDEDLVDETPDDEDDIDIDEETDDENEDEDDSELDPEVDDDLIDDNEIMPPNTPRGPR